MVVENLTVKTHGSRVLSAVSTEKSSGKSVKSKLLTVHKPDVFEFTDYREYLKELQDYRKHLGKPSSNTYFARIGGFKSTNYWGLVISGKRNLSTTTCYKFAKAAGLNVDESLFFENLVCFNQATDSQEKQSYFERLESMFKGKRIKADSFQLISNYLEVLSNWYVICIYNALLLFKEGADANAIAKVLKKKVSIKEIKQALVNLEKLGLVKQEQKNYFSLHNYLNYEENGVNFGVRSFQKSSIARGLEALDDEPVERRSFNCATLTIDKADISKIKKELDRNLDSLIEKYGNKTDQGDALLQVNLQAFLVGEK